MPAGCSASPRYVDRARDIATFLLGALSVDGRLQRTWRDGQAKITGFSEDYGAVADGLIALHRATGELVLARRGTAAGAARRRPVRRHRRSVPQTPRDGERLVARRPDLDDNPAPSGNSLLAGALLALARIYGERGVGGPGDRGGQRRGARSSTARRRPSATRWA